ncbi:hypothetical protein [Streptomyces sp900116325]|uniref:hypothetical protein n=1 Tax=Streptomyces sp. 900116325 TaxID=3154295 RepID=UPI00333036B2
MAKAARVESGVMTSQARTAMSHAALCGLSQEHLGELTMELATRWEARCESGRRDRRGGVRQRDAGAGPKYELVFVDRLNCDLAVAQQAFFNAPCRNAERRFHNHVMDLLTEAADTDG